MSDPASNTTDEPVDPASPSSVHSGHGRLFTGRSGHLAVMAEFLHRGINVAIPEVDLGDDVFVVRGDDEAVTRVQVKTGNAREQAKGSYSAQFNISWGQLVKEDTPPLVYVLAIRYQDRWSDFLVIRRSALNQLRAESGIGSIRKNDGGDPVALILRLVFTREDVRVKREVSFQRFRNAFEPWPPPPQ